MMSRVEIKNWAKEKIKGNKLNLWKGILLYALIVWIATLIVSYLSASLQNLIITLVLMILILFVVSPLSFGICYFFKNFVSNNTTEIGDITGTYSDTLKITSLTILIAIICGIGSLLLVIPGIILSFGLSIVPYVYSENKDLGVMETLKLSYNMMKGHKLDLFVLMISFYGWMILGSLTFGILYIWLYPYMQVSMTKFYVEILNNYNKKDNE